MIEKDIYISSRFGGGLQLSPLPVCEVTSGKASQPDPLMLVMSANTELTSVSHARLCLLPIKVLH